MEPYFKSMQILQCPSDRLRGFSNYTLYYQTGYTDYWYNSAFSPSLLGPGIKETILTSSSNTILSGDGDGGTGVGTSGAGKASTSSYHIVWDASGLSNNYNSRVAWSLPGMPNYVGSQTDTTTEEYSKKKHLDGANYLFADGHVKWLKPDAISNDTPSGSNFTFKTK
jgi:prepilin-type processing-associated H-X9-DG protein